MIREANVYLFAIGILECLIFAIYLLVCYFQLRKEDKEEDEFKDL